MKALITAGGTSEPIDDVRVVTNLSKGRFGASIANALVARGVEVTLLASRALMEQPGWVDPRVERVPFGSFAELDRALTAHTATPPDLLFMAAAVSDYSPIPADGKIRSTDDELVIRMRRNPKLLAGLRERCGRQTTLVGFKLLSGVSNDELVRVARAQLQKCRLDLTVANDLQTFGPGLHPVVLVTPEGGAIPRSGDKDAVAAALVDFVLRRRAVRWFHSVPTGSPAVEDPGKAVAAGLLGFAQQTGLLPAGPDGNVSARADGGLWATPRQVDKASVTPDQLVRVHTDPDAREHRYAGAKPSIDSSVAALLYRWLPDLRALVHFHDAIAIPTAETGFPYPCGCVEEAEEIHRALAGAAARRAYTGGDFLVRLAHHGWLLGLAAPDALLRRWDAFVAAHEAHVARLGGTCTARSPVFAGGAVVGLLATLETAGGPAQSLWLDEASRGDGLGDRLARAIGARPCTIVVDAACGAEAFWVGRGFLPVRREGTRTLLESPALHGRSAEAASVCLVQPVTRRVLLGQRKVGAYPGYWAFPGGGLDAGETHEEAGDRELFEETGIRRPDVPLLIETPVHVGDGTRVWRVVNRAYATLAAPEPTETDELRARWVDLDEALALGPMASGTRTVLRAVHRALS
ncbi:MAG: NUDIX domain-containing protein [Alphaproteobacteria bacterium]|nr:NUDIX domain-containing protein [Alphaproteobacteria bacterium]